MARSVDDLQRLADVFALRDDEEPMPVQLCTSKFAMVRTSVWPTAGPGTIAAMEGAAELLREAGATVEDVDLPPEFDDALLLQEVILQHEAGVAFYREYSTSKDQISDKLEEIAKNIHTGSKKTYLHAFDKIASLRPKIDEIANQYTALITPSAVDVAPIGIEWTGNSDFNGTWTV